MAENKINCEICFHSDGTHTIILKIQSVEDSLKAFGIVKEIERNLKIDYMLEKIRPLCQIEDDTYIFPKMKGVSNEIRLAASTAAMFPDGFPRDFIKDKLDISDSSKDAYLNWDTKTSSKYLTYITEEKKVHISSEGVVWVFEELKNRGVEGIS
jgi:hypothetical protein